ncbi:MAG TPA: periplasmic heavy metal sensor [Thermoanaerobaculia bacterium]|nr:periplasmic heavy metal sensor [Thermoanaerobaculia bacterium]
MRRWWLVIALLLSVGLNVGILAAITARRLGNPQGQGQKPPAAANNPAADPLPRLPRLADRLGLEGEERRKFLDIQWNLYQETSHLRLQLGEVHRHLRHELIQPQPDRAQVDRLLDESSRVYLALEKSLVTNILATRDLLGPEKEKQYLRLIGQLRIPNPGGFGPNAGLGPKRPGARQQQKLRQRLRQQRLQGEGQEGPP